MFGERETRIGGKKRFGIGLGSHENVNVCPELGDVHLGKTVLPGAEKVSGTAETEVFFGNFKTVIRAAHDSEPGLHVVPGGVGDDNTVALCRAAADAAAKLMQLGKTEAFGIFYYHKRGVRNIHADFYDRR